MLKWTACTCQAAQYQRAPRKWWMRLVVTRRHYHCRACGQHMFIPPTEVLLRRVEEAAVRAGAR